MPSWGLTEDQRSCRPWGLDPRLLEPAKTTTDPVQHDIFTTLLEQAIIDSAPFQRLRRVRQLGTTHLVYPGATHNRFMHSLGALRVAQDLLDAALASQGRRAPDVKDLVSAWRDLGPKEADQRIAESTVLVRLGALLHDIGHIPFGHSIEDDLGILTPHDENRQRFAALWGEVAEFVEGRVGHVLDDTAVLSLKGLFKTRGTLFKELRPLILSKYKRNLGQRDRLYPWAEDIVGNTICADLLDYLERDHRALGLPFSLGRRFTSAFFLVGENQGPYSSRVALSIARAGRERTDVVSELLKALRYRYELSERALFHHTKLAADAMVGKALTLWHDAIWLEEADSVLRKLPNFDDLTLEPHAETWRGALNQHNPDALKTTATSAQARLDYEVRSRGGDDALLEYVARLEAGAAPGGPSIAALGLANAGAAGLAQALLDRRLFKVAGRVGPESAPARALFEDWGSSAARGGLERDAQRFAELGASPRVLLWLPAADMRLKLAEVLIHDGRTVMPFVDHETGRGGRGSEIYNAHQRLWAAWVFVRADVAPDDQLAVLAYLAGRLAVSWEQGRDQYGPVPHEWLPRLALAKATASSPRGERVDSLLPFMLAEVAQHAPVGREQTFSEIQSVAEVVVSANSGPAIT